MICIFYLIQDDVQLLFCSSLQGDLSARHEAVSASNAMT